MLLARAAGLDVVGKIGLDDQGQFEGARRSTEIREVEIFMEPLADRAEHTYLECLLGRERHQAAAVVGLPRGSARTPHEVVRE
jgi:hypothetical protein